MPLSSLHPLVASAADPAMRPAKARDRKSEDIALPTDCVNARLSGIFELLGRGERENRPVTEYVSRMTGEKI